MTRRAILFLGLLSIPGCTGGGHAAVGEIDYVIDDPNSAELGAGTSMHIAPSGAASRSSPILGVQTMVLDPRTFADVHAQIEAADFPALDASYNGCPSSAGEICPPLAAGRFDVTAQIGGGSYTTGGDLVILSYSDGTPPALVATVRSLQDIVKSSDWR